MLEDYTPSEAISLLDEGIDRYPALKFAVISLPGLRPTRLKQSMEHARYLLPERRFQQRQDGGLRSRAGDQAGRRAIKEIRESLGHAGQQGPPVRLDQPERRERWGLPGRKARWVPKVPLARPEAAAPRPQVRVFIADKTQEQLIPATAIPFSEAVPA